MPRDFWGGMMDRTRKAQASVEQLTIFPDSDAGSSVLHLSNPFMAENIEDLSFAGGSQHHEDSSDDGDDDDGEAMELADENGPIMLEYGRTKASRMQPVNTSAAISKRTAQLRVSMKLVRQVRGAIRSKAPVR